MQLCRKARRGARRPRGSVRLYVEPLETRSLLSGNSMALLAPVPHETLDQAAILGTLNAGGTLQTAGAIGQGPDGAADVDWYQFTLNQPLEVTLQSSNSAGPMPAPVVLSLYNSDPFNFTDPTMQLGTRLLAQDQTTTSAAAAIDRPLSAGTYYVAVSGAGNLYFHPFLAGSGYDGKTSPYTLQISGTDLGLNPAADGPVVLTSDPANGAVLTSSPAFLHIDLGSALDTSTTPVNQIVQLTYRTDNHFDGSEPPLPLADVEYSSVTNEIVVNPGGPLAPGYYNLSLLPLGATGTSTDPTDFTTPQPWQQNWSITFQVAGIEGNTGPTAVADDTPAGAHQLGDVTTAGLVQAAGYIGADPTMPLTGNPASDVDLYHFQVSGPGLYALTSEVFAGRIGSTLDPALSLFRLDPVTNQLQIVAANDNTSNSAVANNGGLEPLLNDPVLFAGLTAGDYYLTVSSSPNVPDPLLGIEPGQSAPGGGTVFDPNVTHSGTAGFTSGSYVLNVLVQAEQQSPRVVAVTPAQGATLDAPPTTLQVQFSEPVNLQKLAYEAFHKSSNGAMPAVFITATDGTRYSPRFVSFDPTTNTASLLMLDGLPNGPYKLHLSGAAGLTDLAGNPLVGNDPSGDYVVSFAVSGPVRGTNGDCRTWSYVPSGEKPIHEQSLGTLFPNELVADVNIVRQPLGTTNELEQADAFDFAVLQAQQYQLTLCGNHLPAHGALALLDAAGHSVGVVSQHGSATVMQALLQPGSYRVVVQGWTTAQANAVSYQLTLKLLGPPDNPVPLTSGPAPAIRLRLNETIIAPPAPPTDPASNGPSNASSPPTVGTSSTTPSQPPPRLTLPVALLTPDSSGSGASVHVGWQSGNPPTLEGPFGVGLTPLTLVSKPNAVSATTTLVIPAVRLSAEAPPIERPVNLPFNLSAVLGTTPAGNLASTGSTAQAAPQVTLQLPDPMVAEGIVRFLVLTPLINTGGEDAPPAAQPEDRGLAQPLADPPEPISSPALRQTPQSRTATSQGNIPTETWLTDLLFGRLGWTEGATPEAAVLVPPQERPEDKDVPWENAVEVNRLPTEPLAPAKPAVLYDAAWSVALLGAVAGMGLESWRQQEERQAAWDRRIPRRADV